MRRPVDIPPATIGDGDAEHALRGVGPAQDYPCPIGTPVHAPFAASRIVHWGDQDAPGGLAVTGYAAADTYWTVQHLSSRQALNSAAEGEVVALSGNSGSSTTGAHVHTVIVINGRRVNLEALITTGSPAGTQEDTMNAAQEAKLDALIAEVAAIKGEVRGLSKIGGNVVKLLGRLSTVLGGKVEAGKVVGGNVIERLRDLAKLK